MPVNTLFKNRPFSGVRFTYKRVAYPSGDPVDSSYSEGSGVRFYYSLLADDEVPLMEASSFESFISFTMSGAVTHLIEVVPMDKGDIVKFNTHITGANGLLTKGFLADMTGGFIHTGTDLLPIGGTAGLSYNIKTDFSTLDCEFIVNATQSISIGVSGEAGEIIDWNIFVEYKKSFSQILLGPTASDPKPIYPIAR